MKFVGFTPINYDRDGWGILGKRIFVNMDNVVSLQETNKLLSALLQEEDFKSIPHDVHSDYAREITFSNGETIEVIENMQYVLGKIED